MENKTEHKWKVTVINTKTKKVMMTLKDIVADGIIDSVKYRWFVTEKKEMIELPMGDNMFKFSPERDAAIAEMRQQNPGPTPQRPPVRAI